jgi:hypothetical protein
MATGGAVRYILIPFIRGLATTVILITAIAADPN